MGFKDIPDLPINLKHLEKEDKRLCKAIRWALGEVAKSAYWHTLPPPNEVAYRISWNKLGRIYCLPPRRGVPKPHRIYVYWDGRVRALAQLASVQNLNTTKSN